MLLKQYFKHLGLTLILYIILCLTFFIFLLNKNSLNFFSQSHFLRFDAILYQDIKNNGYHDDWLCAFFPAFPFVWKLLNFSPIAISIFNSIIFIFSSSAIACLYKFDWKRQLFLQSIPSLIFMFVPYTEALFFLTGTLLLFGLKNNKNGLIFLGLLLGSLVRPTTFVFIPAIIGAYFFATLSVKEGLLKSIVPTIILILGLFLTILIHFIYTGKWFVFFEAQKLWKNFLHFPTLPLKSWGGDGSTRFDGSALAIALMCGIFVGDLSFRKFKTQTIISKDLAFSILYIFGTSLVILAYRDGNLYSLNRFIYATPFVAVVLNSFFNEYQFKWKYVWILLITSELFWLLFSSYNHIHNFLLFTIVSLYFVLILFSKHSNKIISFASIILLITINSIGIIKLFYRFLNGGWVG